MEFNLSTPALLFSAISLFMLAHTNRFLALSSLIRQHIALYDEKKDENILGQIENFRIRLNVIKNTQIFGVISFLFCVISMFLIFVNAILPAEIAFGLSLASLFVSLALSLRELFLSIGALKLEMRRVQPR
jgi:uncharacterized Tic20 family protein